jgi:hypothetical protein
MALDAPRGAGAAGRQRAGAAGARVRVERLRRCVSDHIRTITAPRRVGPRGSSQGPARRIPMRDGTDVSAPTVPRDCARKERYSLMILNAASNVSVYEWHCMTGTVWRAPVPANLGTGEAGTGEGCTGERRTGATALAATVLPVTALAAMPAHRWIVTSRTRGRSGAQATRKLHLYTEARTRQVQRDRRCEL